MSRCYSYPPPGYLRNTGVLIDSIKLQREKEKVKTEIKKEKKREKKEKRKARKEKEKTTDIGDGKISKLNYDKLDLPERNRAVSCGGYFQKSIEDEAGLLEKSDLTEEHGQPVGSPNVSSDSTWTSNKRKRDTSSTGSINCHGTIVRIRLPLKKQRVSDGALTTHSNEQLCSTSGREDVLAPQKNESVIKIPNQEQCCSNNAKENIFAEDCSTRPKELSCPVPERIETKSHKNKTRRAESLYKALVENWVPPSLQHEGNDCDEEDWLFRPKQENRHGSERLKAGNNVTCGGSNSLMPHAHYLPEADIYALPYTVPF